MPALGSTDGYYTNMTLAANGSLSFTYVPTLNGGQPSPQTLSAFMVQQSIDTFKPFVLNKTYPAYAFTPYHAMFLTVAVQTGQITAAQLQEWYAGAGNMPVGGIKGFTSYDYSAGTTVPTATQVMNSTTLLGLNTADSTTVNAVQQTNAQVNAAAKNLPALSTNQQHVEKMYLAGFLRAPEKEGLDFWTKMLDSGKTLTEVGDVIFGLPIVKAVYAEAMTHTQFVTAIYNNVFGKAPDAGGLAFWLARMDGGEHRGDLVMDMMNAGLGTAIGTPGRDYIVNRFDTVHYATQSQVKANAGLSVDKLIELSSKVGADAAAITAYQQTVDAQLATVVGTNAMALEPVFG